MCMFTVLGLYRNAVRLMSTSGVGLSIPFVLFVWKGPCMCLLLSLRV